MLSLFKWLFGLLLTLAFLLALAFFIVPRIIDPNDYRDDFIALVKQKLDRDLLLDGDLEISVFPWLGVKTQNLSLSQPTQIGDVDGPMITVASGQLRVKFLPLLSRRLEVDTVVLQQPYLRLITLADGVNSFTGLTGNDDNTEATSESAQQNASDSVGAVALVIQGLEISAGSAIWDDRQAGKKYAIEQLDIETGNLIGAVPADFHAVGVVKETPSAAAIKFDLQGLALIDTEKLTISMSAVKADLSQADQSLNVSIASVLVDEASNTTANQLSFNAELQGTDKIKQTIAGSVERAQLNSDSETFSVQGLQADLSQADQSLDVSIASLLVDEANNTIADQLSFNAELQGADKIKQTIAGSVDRVQLDSDREIFSLQGLQAELLSKGNDRGDLKLSATAPRLTYKLASQSVLSVSVKAIGELAERKFNLSVIDLSVDLAQQQASSTSLELKSGDLIAQIDQFWVNNFIDQPLARGKLSLAPFNLVQLLKDIEIDYLPNDPNVLKSVGLNAQMQLGSELLELKDLRLKIDQSSIKGAFSARNFDKPQLNFDLILDKMNLDDYLPAGAEQGSASSSDVSGASALAAPMAIFKGLHANGQFKATTLLSGGLEMTDIDVLIASTPGKVTITPKANLYDGKLGGTMVYTEQGDKSVLHVNNQISLINLSKFLRAIDVNDQLSGTGSLQLDLTVTEQNGVQHNTGSFKVLASNGAVQGVDLEATFAQLMKGYQSYESLRGREPEPLLGKSDSEAATRFDELIGTFNIEGLKLVNKDLQVTTPLFKISGRGSIDIATQQLDYQTDVQVVKGVEGAAQKVFSKLQGVTIPIRYTGSLSSPNYRVDKSGLVKFLLKNEAKQELSKELGIESDRPLSTKEILQQALINKINKKARKGEPQEPITIEPPKPVAAPAVVEQKAAAAVPESPGSSSPGSSSSGSSSSGRAPDVFADPSAAQEPAAVVPKGAPQADQPSEQQTPNEERKEKLLEGLFN